MVPVHFPRGTAPAPYLSADLHQESLRERDLLLRSAGERWLARSHDDLERKAASDRLATFRAGEMAIEEFVRPLKYGR